MNIYDKAQELISKEGHNGYIHDYSKIIYLNKF